MSRCNVYEKEKKWLWHILNKVGLSIGPCSAPDTAHLNLLHVFLIVNFKHCFQSFKHEGI